MKSLIKLTVLGSGSCVPLPARSSSAYHVEIDDMSALLDCGPGALRQMAKASIDYKKISHIFLSHFHVDHVADLAPLLFALRYTPGFQRTAPLTVYGPVGLKSFMQKLSAVYGDFLVNPDGFEQNLVELSDETIDIEDKSVTASSMFHSEKSNGYRFEYNGKSMVYSGDTGYCDNLVELAREVDLALFECSFPDDNVFETHLSPTLCGKIAQQANVKQLLLSHFYPEMENEDVMGLCKKQFAGPIMLGHDLMCVDI